MALVEVSLPATKICCNMPRASGLVRPLPSSMVALARSEMMLSWVGLELVDQVGKIMLKLDNGAGVRELLRFIGQLPQGIG